MVEANAPIRQREGALQYEVFRSAEDPSKVVLMEHWANRELYDKHWNLQLEGGPPDPVGQETVAADRCEGQPAFGEESRQTANYGGNIHSPSLPAGGNGRRADWPPSGVRKRDAARVEWAGHAADHRRAPTDRHFA